MLAIYLNKVIYGDCLEVMKRLPDKSIDFILTDLPFGSSVCPWEKKQLQDLI